MSANERDRPTDTTPPTIVRQATLADIPYIDHLQLKESDAVGFLPDTIWQPAIEAGRVVICTVNDDAAGYLLRGPIRPVTKIYQAVVQEDARREANAAALTRYLRDEANRNHVERISLYCAEDLPANQFWPAVGWQLVGERRKHQTRGRLHNRYQIDLHAHYQMNAALTAELHGERTLKILDLLGVKDQFLTPVRKRIRKRT